MSKVEERIKSLGYELPASPAPLGEYVPAVQTGSLVFTCGSLPTKDGLLIATGLIHKSAADDSIDVETGQHCAAIAVLNALAAVKGIVGDLDRITRIVKVVGYVAVAPGFQDHPAVVNGASTLLGQVFGDSGKHARSAVGVHSLPLGSPVEIELVVEVAT